MNQSQRDIKRKLKILNHAKEMGSVVKTCRYFRISRAVWRQLKVDQRR